MPAGRHDVLPPPDGARMPRYFFNVCDGEDIRDEDGMEFNDIYVAQAQAIRMSGEILREMGLRFWDGTEWRLEVTDNIGNVLLVLRFSAEERPLPLDPSTPTYP
jgi:hypothetical protein